MTILLQFVIIITFMLINVFFVIAFREVYSKI